MPLFFRDSVGLGPFTVNISRSGLGISTGVNGFRIGTGPKGHYIHAGANGIYYRKTLGSLGRQRRSIPANEGADYTAAIAKIAPNEKLPTYVTEDGVLMRRIISAEAEVLVSENHSEALQSLNEARGQPSYTLMLCCLATVGLILGLVVQSPVLITVFIVLLVVAGIVGSALDEPRRNVVFAYGLEPSAENRYRALCDAIDRIGAAKMTWFVKAHGNITNLHAWKKNSGASSLIENEVTSVSYELPKGIVSNITPPMIAIDGKKCYFLPDCILVEENKRFGAVRYERLRTGVRHRRMIMEEAPSDAQLVGETWRYVNKGGGPDRRFKDNKMLPICLLEEIAMVSEGGFKGLLQVSKRGVGSAFTCAISEIGAASQELRAAEPLLISEAT